MTWDWVAKPCPWFSTATEQQRHREWLEQPLRPIRWEDTDWCAGPHWAGQPVLVPGHTRPLYLRLEGASFRRWCGSNGGGGDRRIGLGELTTRDPRQLWADPWVLALALAISGDPRNNPFPEPYEEGSALYELAADAEEELRARPAEVLTNPGNLASSEDAAPRRGWLRHEVAAQARLGDYLEAVVVPD